MSILGLAENGSGRSHWSTRDRLLYTPCVHTAPHSARKGGIETTSSTGILLRRHAEEVQVQSAFWALHAERLHGFALLITLGDGEMAARVATIVLTDGARHARTLRHPERAAAWLRARVLRLVPRRARGGVLVDTDHAASLQALGVGAASRAALGVLNATERAALVATDVECLAQPDVEVVLDRNTRATRRILARARRRYTAAFLAARETIGRGAPRGPIAQHVRDVAQIALMGPERSS